MKLPWSRTSNKDLLVVALTPDSVAYVHAQAASALPHTIKQWGMELRGDDSPTGFKNRVRALGLPKQKVYAILALPQYQFLQIDAPAVPPEELRAAARWHIRDMVDAHLDDLTLDVLHVGDDRQRASQHLFVVAAANTAIQEATALATACGLQLSVIDVRETAQRNLQCALAAATGLQARATAALTVHGEQCLLTISARDELFYSRRLAWDPNIIAPAPTYEAEDESAAFPDIFSVSEEYLPDSLQATEYMSAADATPSLVIELQRSFDVWERTWPELPLAGLVVQAPEHTSKIAALLQRELGLLTEPLNTELLFKEFKADPAQDKAHAACSALLGALLRTEQRKL